MKPADCYAWVVALFTVLACVFPDGQAEGPADKPAAVPASQASLPDSLAGTPASPAQFPENVTADFTGDQVDPTLGHGYRVQVCTADGKLIITRWFTSRVRITRLEQPGPGINVLDSFSDEVLFSAIGRENLILVDQIQWKKAAKAEAE